jgi:hypothetical protein
MPLNSTLTLNRSASSPRPSPPFGMEERVAAGRERRCSAFMGSKRERSLRENLTLTLPPPTGEGTVNDCFYFSQPSSGKHCALPCERDGERSSLYSGNAPHRSCGHPLQEPERDCAESQSQRLPSCCGWSATQPRSGSGVQSAKLVSANSPHEPHSQSGAEDARTPDASRGRRAPGTRASVWSAGVLSAALHPTVFQGVVQGFNARNFLWGNSLPIRWGEGGSEIGTARLGLD